MEIKLAEDGMWGGVIPDVVRNNRITLKLGDNLLLKLSGEEFEYLRSFLDETTKDMFKRCQAIVENYDARNHLFAEYLEKYHDAHNNRDATDKERLRAVWDIITDLEADYWNVR